MILRHEIHVFELQIKTIFPVYDSHSFSLTIFFITIGFIRIDHLNLPSSNTDVKLKGCRTISDVLKRLERVCQEVNLESD